MDSIQLSISINGDRRDPRQWMKEREGQRASSPSRRFVLAVHWQPPRYYFNVNVLAMVSKINNNAYATDTRNDSERVCPRC